MLRSDIRSIKNILISMPPYSKSPETAKKYLSEVEAAVMLPQTLLNTHTANTLDGCHVTANAVNADDYDNVLHGSSNILLISTTSVYGAPPLDTAMHQVVTEFTPVANSSNSGYSAAMR
jgi:hypothetical protein